MTEAKINSVLMLIQTFLPAIGGAEKQALELSRTLVLRGFRVTVVTRRISNTAAEENMDGVRVVRLSAAGSGALNSAGFMVKSFFYLLKSSAQYDIVHVHLASSHAVAALLAGKFTGKRTLVKLADGRAQNEITLSRKNFLGRMKLAFFRFTRPRLMVLNGEVFDWLKNSPEYGGLRLIQFRNGVDTLKYTPPLYHEKIKAKAALGLGNSLIVLFVGRLDPKKRIREFVEIWAEIFSEERIKPKMHFVIVGAGPEEGPVKEAVASLGLKESVTVAGMQSDLLPYYRAADIFILPSITEGLSNSMLEAMSCGLAIMASRVGGAREAVIEGESGCLFDPFNRQEIKEHLRKYLSDGSLAVKMGERSRDIAVKRYSMSKVADELLEIYRSE
jgi:glycosyltransferase involved in cell wall biosynthesis